MYRTMVDVQAIEGLSMRLGSSSRRFLTLNLPFLKCVLVNANNAKKIANDLTVDHCALPPDMRLTCKSHVYKPFVLETFSASNTLFFCPKAKIPSTQRSCLLPLETRKLLLVAT